MNGERMNTDTYNSKYVVYKRLVTERSSWQDPQTLWVTDLVWGQWYLKYKTTPVERYRHWEYQCELG